MTGENRPFKWSVAIFQMLYDSTLTVCAVPHGMPMVKEKTSQISGIKIILSTNEKAGKETYLSSHTLGSETLVFILKQRIDPAVKKKKKNLN